jgi:hypothetical protein
MFVVALVSASGISFPNFIPKNLSLIFNKETKRLVLLTE